VKTTNRGEFRLVVTSRTDISFNTEYFLLLSAPVQFELEESGMPVLCRYYSFSTADRAADGVRDLGTLKIVINALDRIYVQRATAVQGVFGIKVRYL
jgi:hypothetical protein